MKLSFKTTKPTGKYRWLDKPTTYIILDSKNVGMFGEDTEGKTIIKLQIIKDDINSDGNPNCNWKWINLAKKLESIEEGKEWIKANIKVITEKWNLNINN
jgi:hypothetical protein